MPNSLHSGNILVVRNLAVRPGVVRVSENARTPDWDRPAAPTKQAQSNNTKEYLLHGVFERENTLGPALAHQSSGVRTIPPR